MGDATNYFAIWNKDLQISLTTSYYSNVKKVLTTRQMINDKKGYIVGKIIQHW